MYKLDCPKCGASPEKANLSVVSLTISTEPGVPLTRNGYNFYKTDPHVASRTDAYDETVTCFVCGSLFDLKICRSDRKYGIESIIARSDDLEVRVPVFPQACTYVRIVDVKDGSEIERAYWDDMEWADSESGAMGAIMGAIKSVLDETFRKVKR
jgi:hypothetical protein